MRLIKTEDAVGHVLCHDMTQIIKDQYKDARFRKGHVVTEEDIPVLLSGAASGPLRAGKHDPQRRERGQDRAQGRL